MTIPMPAGVITEFKLDPNVHDFLFTGDELQTGMRVLVADDLFWLKALFSEHDVDRVLKTQRWCTVGRIERTSQSEYDQDGYMVTGANHLVAFEAIYDDGHRCKRTYNRSFSWYAEKPIGEYAQIVRNGLRQAYPDLVGV